MLPLIVILLVIGYFILDRSGMLDDIASSLQNPRRNRPVRDTENESPQTAARDSDSRLEVFEDFIEGLDKDIGENDE